MMIDGPAVVRAAEPPAVQLVDEALVGLGFTRGRVIAANNLGSPVVAASKDSQGVKPSSVFILSSSVFIGARCGPSHR
jgi:hypothetical protein